MALPRLPRQLLPGRGSRKLLGQGLPVSGALGHRDDASGSLERPLRVWKGPEASAQRRGKMATTRGGSGPDPGSRGLLLLSFSVVLAGEVTPPRSSGL